MLIDIAVNGMKANKTDLITADPVKAYLSAMGRKGAAVHSLSAEARQLGVRVRLMKKTYIAQGMTPAAAHAKARANFQIHSSGRHFSRLGIEAEST